MFVLFIGIVVWEVKIYIYNVYIYIFKKYVNCLEKKIINMIENDVFYVWIIIV